MIYDRNTPLSTGSNISALLIVRGKVIFPLTFNAFGFTTIRDFYPSGTILVSLDGNFVSPPDANILAFLSTNPDIDLVYLVHEPLATVLVFGIIYLLNIDKNPERDVTSFICQYM